MCGIAGFWAPRGLGPEADHVLRGMISTLQHRGPDDTGVWFDAARGIALGHRRLSIIDLSSQGRQPMTSSDGALVLIHNGEIYNFRELKRDLERRGVRFRGGSDTEVILASVQEWGLTEAVQRFVGMFAFVLFDRAKGLLYLVRDRLGEKPLYHGCVGDVLLFGSELKALRAYPGWTGEIDRGALTQYLRYRCVPGTRSIYRGVSKVPPASILRFSDATGGKAAACEYYWSATDVASRGAMSSTPPSEDEALAELTLLLRRTIEQQMVADVPIGAFLSGGVDSSLIVAMMQEQATQAVRTFTIGFAEPSHDEAPVAKQVAECLGTDHTTLQVTPAEALSVIPRLAIVYDEPFSDSSQVPTYLLSQLTRRHVTVSLSGDGGDELFGGYERYVTIDQAWPVLRAIPRSARVMAGRLLRSVPPKGWDTLLMIGRLRRRGVPRGRVTGERVHKFADLLGADTWEALYEQARSDWRDQIVLGCDGATTEAGTNVRGPSRVGGILNSMMLADLVTYLPDDILVKVDRATMAASLESRAPFLDHRVVEFAWRVPAAMKVRHGQGKWLLRRLAERFVPSRLLDRPKMGFDVPIGSWLRGPLRDWAAALVDETRLTRDGYFNPSAIREKWEEHQRGVRNWQYLLWDVLMFQAWLQAQ